MIVDDLHVMSAFIPAEAQAELIVDAHAPLSFPIALECLEPIAGWRSQVLYARGQVKLFEFSQSHPLYRHEAANAIQLEQRPRFSALE